MSQQPKMPRRARAQAGFMMLEVLVSVLIFSFGVLGLVGLQASMSRAQTAAKDRADAAALASELIGLMWADTRSNLASYDGAGCAGYARCKDWTSKVAATFPNSNTNVTSVLVAGETTVYNVSVTITWTPPDGGQHTYATQTTISTN